MRNTNFGPLVTLKMQAGGGINKARRALLGLLDKPTAAIPEPKPSQPLATVTNTPPAPTSSPLATVAEKMAQAPMSRRQFLEKTGKTAASQALQDVAGGFGIRAAAKGIAKAAIPSHSEQEIAEKIAKYADNFIEDNDAIKAAYSLATKQPFEEAFSLAADDFPAFEILSDISMYGKPAAITEAAKAVGLDIASVAKATGLSVDDVKRVMKKDDDLLTSIANNAESRGYLNQVLEDGRPKEAYRSTSLSDIDENELDDLIQSVINEHGPHTDEQDLLYLVSDKLRSRFFEKEQGVNDANDYLGGAVRKSIIDDAILDEVYEQGVLNYDYMDLENRVLDKFYGRQPKAGKGSAADDFDDYYDELD